MVEPAAAELLGDVWGVEAQLLHLAGDLQAELGRHDARPLDIGFERVEFLLDEAADGGDHHLLLGGEGEIHRTFSLRPTAG